MRRRRFLAQLSAALSAASPLGIGALSRTGTASPAEPGPCTLARNALHAADAKVPVGRVLRPMRGRPGYWLVEVRMAVPMRLLPEPQGRLARLYRDVRRFPGLGLPFVYLADIESISADPREVELRSSDIPFGGEKRWNPKGIRAGS